MSVTRVKAIHPAWTAHLLLSEAEAAAAMEGKPRRGRYRLAADRLELDWEDGERDAFLRVGRDFVHEAVAATAIRFDMLRRRGGLIQIAGQVVRPHSLRFTIPGTEAEVSLRLHGSDGAVYQQVFGRREYETPDLPAAAATVVDLGANIGLSALFFALRYRQARLLAVEPDAGNFALLEANTAPFGERVRREQAAIWNRDGMISLADEDEAGNDLDGWGIQVTEAPSPSARQTPCFRLDTLLDRHGFQQVDILKVDIEGAEVELFDDSAAAWLPRIGLIVVETHDRFRPGSDAAVRRAVGPGFTELPRLGENRFFRRIPA